MSDIQDMVEAAKAPGKFNIVDVVKDRSYPKSQIDVFVDEGVAFIAAELNDELAKIADLMDKKNLNKVAIDDILKKRDDLLDQKEKLIEEMGGARYIFHLTGISEGKRQDAYDQALEKYPMEYEKSKNPFTGQQEKNEIESSERDRYFTAILWHYSIEKIVAPDGSEQDGISFEDALELRRSLPLASNSGITEAIEKMRAATALFMMSVNEDFLAKS